MPIIALVSARAITGGDRFAGSSPHVLGAAIPVAHIWTRSAQPWIAIPEGALRFEQEPPDLLELGRALSAAQIGWGMRAMATETLPPNVRDAFGFESSRATRRVYRVARRAGGIFFAAGPRPLTLLPTAYVPMLRQRLPGARAVLRVVSKHSRGLMRTRG